MFCTFQYNSAVLPENDCVRQHALRLHGAGELSYWPLVEGTANAFAVRSARALLPARGAVCGLLCVLCISNHLLTLTSLSV
jgi:hypothetical protein